MHACPDCGEDCDCSSGGITRTFCVHCPIEDDEDLNDEDDDEDW